MLLKDKVIAITGVGIGLGRVLTAVAAREGAKVSLAARSAERLSALVDEVRAIGGEAVCHTVDVASQEQCEEFIETTQSTFGRIDGVINSAYRMPVFKTFEEGDLVDWQRAMDITCFGALRICKAVLPVMKRQRSGAIVNVGALATVRPSPGQADYATAKSALSGATRQLAQEFGAHNIRVNCVRLSGMWGPPLQSHLRAVAQSRGETEQIVVERLKATFPLGVIPPEEDCAMAVLVLVSDYARMVTGATLDVNGGQYMC